MATKFCKMCGSPIDYKRFRNECPMEFCSWFCYHDYQDRIRYQKAQEERQKKIEKKLNKLVKGH